MANSKTVDGNRADFVVWPPGIANKSQELADELPGLTKKTEPTRKNAESPTDPHGETNNGGKL